MVHVAGFYTGHRAFVRALDKALGTTGQPRYVVSYDPETQTWTISKRPAKV